MTALKVAVRKGKENVMKVRTYIVIVLLASIWLGLPGLARAQSEIVIRTTGPIDNGLLTRYNLTLLSSDSKRNLNRVRIPAGASASSIISALGSEYTVVNAELNSSTLLPTIVNLNQSTVSVLNDTPVTSDATLTDSTDAVLNQSTVSVLDQSTVSVLDALLTMAPTPFYGTTVIAGMLSQPAMQIVENNAAHSVATGAGVVIADINNGVDTSHPGLQGVLTAGYDFTTNNTNVSVFAGLSQSTVSVLNDTTDLSSSDIVTLNQSTVSVLNDTDAATINSMPAAWAHGTMVAGVLHLTSPQSRIMPLRAFAADGTGNLFNVIQAIYYAVDNGAQVINMSFGCACNSAELNNALSYAAGRGVVLVASVGNENTLTKAYPAASSLVIGVSATNFDDTKAWFSNYGGANAYVSAPGAGIITLYPGFKYAAGWGTSFSAPMVSGGAALLLQAGYSPSGVAQQLSKTAVNNTNNNSGTYIGRGRIDLYKAVSGN